MIKRNNCRVIIICHRRNKNLFLARKSNGWVPTIMDAMIFPDELAATRHLVNYRPEVELNDCRLAVYNLKTSITCSLDPIEEEVV